MSSLRKLLAIALVLLMQGPAMMVQEVAWVKMLVSYTQERGLKRGVIETFDGKHPCELCKKAAEIRQQEQSQEPTEKQMPASRRRLAWVEMVSGELLEIPEIAEYVISERKTPCTARDSGKGADAPDAPPPEWGRAVSC